MPIVFAQASAIVLLQNTIFLTQKQNSDVPLREHDRTTAVARAWRIHGIVTMRRTAAACVAATLLVTANARRVDGLASIATHGV